MVLPFYLFVLQISVGARSCPKGRDERLRVLAGRWGRGRHESGCRPKQHLDIDTRPLNIET